MAVQSIVKMMADFLEGKIEAEDFSFSFPDVLMEQWEEILKENQQIAYFLNEDMPDICANFEPEPQARSQRPEYLDEKQFKQQVRKVYQDVLKLLNKQSNL